MPKTKGTPDVVEGVVVTSPFEAEAADADGELPAFDMFGQRWVIRKKPTTLHISRLASVSKTSPEAVGVVDRLVGYCLAEQADDFREAYFDAAPADGNDQEMFADVIGALVSGGTGRPPA
jgi:hypothetical protein